MIGYEMTQYKRILFFRTDMLGDTLLNLPVLDALKHAYPESHITFVCHPSLAEFLEGYPAIDRFLPFEAGRRKAGFSECRMLLSQIKRGNFDLAIVSNSRKDFHLVTRLANIPRRIGYGRKWGILLTDRLDDKKFMSQKHEIESNLELLTPLGIQVRDPSFELPGSVQDLHEAECLLASEKLSTGNPLVLLHPFSSDLRKCWPIENFVNLIKKIKENVKVDMAVIGSEGERNSAHELISKTKLNIVNLSGKTNLRTLCAVIRKSVLLIGHDSGPMHMAAGVGTPTVSIFAKFSGGPNPVRWRPWGTGHVVIHKDLKDLTVDELWRSVESKLKT